MQNEDDIRKEIEELSKLADESHSQLLDLFDGTLEYEDVEATVEQLDDTANPQLSHKLYYNTQRLLKDNLPSGEKNAKLRRYIYDEKNLFLNRGQQVNPDTGIRGSDGRMTYIMPFLETSFKTVSDWVASGGTSFDLFMRFRALNEAHGYHSQNFTDPADFDSLIRTTKNVDISTQKEDEKKEDDTPLI